MCHGMTFEWVLAWFMGHYPPAKLIYIKKVTNIRNF